jgi:hypothetical protein
MQKIKFLAIFGSYIKNRLKNPPTSAYQLYKEFSKVKREPAAEWFNPRRALYPPLGKFY